MTAFAPHRGTGCTRVFAMVALVIGGFATATPCRATSIYSMNLIGERIEAGDVRAIALGGAATLLADSLAVLQSNPAMLAQTKKVTIGVSQYIAIDEGRSPEYTEMDISVTFSGLRVGFPIGRLFVLSVGYLGRYDPNGSFAEQFETASGQRYTETTVKKGSLFSVPFTASFDVTRFASLGLTFSLEKGSVEEQVNVEFDNRLLPRSRNSVQEDFSGTGYAAGIVLRPMTGLILGATFDSAIDYDTDVRWRYQRSVLDSTYTSSARLPSQTTLALSWGVSRGWLIAATAAWRDFADFEGLDFPTDRLGREESYSLGVEYRGGVPLRGRRFPLRFSVNQQKLPYDHPAGQGVEKLLFGFGTALTLGGGRGKLDFAVVAGTIGSQGTNGLEDRVVRIHLGISGGEVWSRKRAGEL